MLCATTYILLTKKNALGNSYFLLTSAVSACMSTSGRRVHAVQDDIPSSSPKSLALRASATPQTTPLAGDVVKSVPATVGELLVAKLGLVYEAEVFQACGAVVRPAESKYIHSAIINYHCLGK